MSDPTTRGAARIATLVALPVALVAGVVAFRVLDTGGDQANGGAEPSRPGSTAAVSLPAPALAERPATVCRALFARLPDRLGDLPRRPVTAGPEQNAAYGDPPVTIACGVAGPSVAAGAQYLEIEGVCWYAEQGPDAASWVLQGREVPLVVMVPTRYTGQYLVDLAKPISAAIAETSRVCG